MNRIVLRAAVIIALLFVLLVMARSPMADIFYRESVRQQLSGNNRQRSTLLRVAARLNTTHPKVWGDLCDSLSLSGKEKEAIEACVRQTQITNTSSQTGSLLLNIGPSTSLRSAQDFACGLPLRSRPQDRLKFESRRHQISGALLW
jgi:hypothetical protein